MNQLKAAKGKGKGKGKGKSKGKSKVTPRYWNDMSWNEQLWLHELWSGRLRSALDEAESKCHRVQARPFSMGERDA